MPVSRKRSTARPSKSSASTPRDDRAAPEHPSESRQRWLGAGILAVMTALAYIPAFTDGFVWDDSDHVPQVPFQRTATALKWVWFKLGATPQYYPLTHTMFWIESRLWGLHPAGYHVVNVLLHVGCALLVWRLLRQLEVCGAYLAAAIFAIHPVHVESVAWITEGKNTLSALFYLLSMGAALRAWGLSKSQPAAGPSLAERDAPPPVERAVNWRAYTACIVFFILAVLSKTVTCTLPAALILILWWKRGRVTRRDALMLVPLFAIALGVAKLTAGMEQWNVGAVGPDFQFSFADRVLIAGRAIWFYAVKLLWPHPLMFIYPRWEIDPRDILQWIFPAGVVAVTLALWFYRKRIGRGPLAAVLFFIGTLFPALGFVDVYPMRFSFVADHFQYLASLGLIALAAHRISKLEIPARVLRGIDAAVLFVRGQMKKGEVPPETIVVYARRSIAALVFLVLGALTFRQALAYRDEPTLWRDTLARNPGCWIAMDDLAGDAERRAADADQRGAETERRAAAAEAFEYYFHALAIHPRQTEALQGLGRLWERDHPPNWDSSAGAFDAASALRPDDARPVHEKAMMLARKSDSLARRGDGPGASAALQSAMAEYEKALALEPRLESARLEYAKILQRLNRPNDALDQYRRALDNNPDSVGARMGLAGLLIRADKYAEARQLIDEALEIDASNANAYYMSGICLMQDRRYTEAAARFRSAIDLDPEFAPSYDGLGNALAAQGETGEAAKNFREAIKHDPNFAEAKKDLERLQGRGR